MGNPCILQACSETSSLLGFALGPHFLAFGFLVVAGTEMIGGVLPCDFLRLVTIPALCPTAPGQWGGRPAPVAALRDSWCWLCTSSPRSGRVHQPGTLPSLQEHGARPYQSPAASGSRAAQLRSGLVSWSSPTLSEPLLLALRAQLFVPRALIFCPSLLENLTCKQ